MAKKGYNSGNGEYMKDVRKKSGKQEIVDIGDFGSRECWGKAHNPESVSAMVGKTGEFARYKHREKK